MLPAVLYTWSWYSGYKTMTMALSWRMASPGILAPLPHQVLVLVVRVIDQDGCYFNRGRAHLGLWRSGRPATHCLVVVHVTHGVRMPESTVPFCKRKNTRTCIIMLILVSALLAVVNKLSVTRNNIITPSCLFCPNRTGAKYALRGSCTCPHYSHARRVLLIVLIIYY